MKCVPFLAALFFICSCAFNPDYMMRDYTISNKSAETVTFTLKNYDNTLRTLQPANGVMTKRMYGAPTLEFDGHPRVTYNAGMDNCTINDMTSWTVELHNNNATETITIKETNNMLGIWDEKVQLTKSASPVSKKLYTKTPNFTATFANGALASRTEKWDGNTYKLTVW